jgi:hypothetical protein
MIELSVIAPVTVFHMMRSILIRESSKLRIKSSLGSAGIKFVKKLTKKSPYTLYFCYDIHLNIHRWFGSSSLTRAQGCDILSCSALVSTINLPARE